MVDGNDIWESLFGIMKGDVPKRMTPDVCQQLADNLAAMREGVDRGMVERAKEIEEAAKAVLVFQCGQAPSLGYIKDNDRSRAAIARLATALDTEQPR